MLRDQTRQGGSSPRMRGTPGFRIQSSLERRFIPAYAGNTTGEIEGAFPVPVHPRVCGEHIIGGIIHVLRTGSSPRMRGTRLLYLLAHKQRRFIPAYAGNTGISINQCGGTTVHPRVCGEHSPLSALAKKHTGSSPRMRGTHTTALVTSLLHRFIPAYAGNTYHMPLTSAAPPVHPRVCGEHVVP